MVLQDPNVFIEYLIPGQVLRKIDPQELEIYREPFKATGEIRRPILSGARNIVVVSEAPNNPVITYMNDFLAFMAQATDLPKLYIRSDPGFITPGADQVVAGWPNLTTVTVNGHHFMQFDSPDAMGTMIRDFLSGLECTLSNPCSLEPLIGTVDEDEDAPTGGAQTYVTSGLAVAIALVFAPFFSTHCR